MRCRPLRHPRTGVTHRRRPSKRRVRRRSGDAVSSTRLLHTAASRRISLGEPGTIWPIAGHHARSGSSGGRSCRNGSEGGRSTCASSRAGPRRNARRRATSCRGYADDRRQGHRPRTSGASPPSAWCCITGRTVGSAGSQAASLVSVTASRERHHAFLLRYGSGCRCSSEQTMPASWAMTSSSCTLEALGGRNV